MGWIREGSYLSDGNRTVSGSRAYKERGQEDAMQTVSYSSVGQLLGDEEARQGSRTKKQAPRADQTGNGTGRDI